MMTFEIYRRLTWRGRRWFWRLRARNHEIVCSGQSSGFANRRDMIDTIEEIVALDIARIREVE